MIISKETYKDLTTRRDLIKCKLEIVETVIEQVVTYKYLGEEISSNRDIRH